MPTREKNQKRNASKRIAEAEAALKTPEGTLLKLENHQNLPAVRDTHLFVFAGRVQAADDKEPQAEIEQPADANLQGAVD